MTQKIVSEFGEPSPNYHLPAFQLAVYNHFLGFKAKLTVTSIHFIYLFLFFLIYLKVRNRLKYAN